MYDPGGLVYTFRARIRIRRVGPGHARRFRVEIQRFSAATPYGFLSCLFRIFAVPAFVAPQRLLFPFILRPGCGLCGQGFLGSPFGFLSFESFASDFAGDDFLGLLIAAGF
jgi:hypothetical protein